jgi:hypothetical protein
MPPNRCGESLGIIQIFEVLMPSGRWTAVVNLAHIRQNLYALVSPSLSTLCLSFPASLASILCLPRLPLLPASLALPSFPSSFAAPLAASHGQGRYAALPGII